MRTFPASQTLRAHLGVAGVFFLAETVALSYLPSLMAPERLLLSTLLFVGIMVTFLALALSLDCRMAEQDRAQADNERMRRQQRVIMDLDQARR